MFWSKLVSKEVLLRKQSLNRTTLFWSYLKKTINSLKPYFLHLPPHAHLSSLPAKSLKQVASCHQLCPSPLKISPLPKYAMLNFRQMGSWLTPLAHRCFLPCIHARLLHHKFVICLLRIGDQFFSFYPASVIVRDYHTSSRWLQQRFAISKFHDLIWCSNAGFFRYLLFFFKSNFFLS